MSSYVMDDILIGIFYFFPEEERQFQHDRVRAHRFFYERQTRYPVLRGVNFRKREVLESDEVDQAYRNLRATGLLVSFGMDFNPHEFSSECKSSFEKRIKKLFTKRELQDLRDLSREFQREFALDEWQ